MTCIFCGFENPDSETACFRCGRSLDTDQIEVVPERLKRGPSNLRWQALLAANQRMRQLGRKRRGQPLAAETLSEPLDFRAWVYALLSLVPGLGHLFAGRRLWAVFWFAVWLLAVAVRNALDPPPYWSYLILVFWNTLPNRALMCLHTVIILHAFRLVPSRLNHFLQALQMLALCVTSWGMLTLLQMYFSVQAPFTISEVWNDRYRDPTVVQNDQLAVWPLPQWRTVLPVGMVVVYSPTIQPEEVGDREAVYGDVVGTIQAGPGETISHAISELWSGERKLAAPDWLEAAAQGRKLSTIRLRSDEYLIVPPISLVYVNSFQAFVVKRSQMKGVVSDILNPRARRQRLKVR